MKIETRIQIWGGVKYSEDGAEEGDFVKNKITNEIKCCASQSRVQEMGIQ